jgi:hypothetical protein
MDQLSNGSNVYTYEYMGRCQEISLATYVDTLWADVMVKMMRNGGS